jgi:hypothetical protein
VRPLCRRLRCDGRLFARLWQRVLQAERFQVLEAAVSAGDRVLVIGQSNHPATVRAVEIAKKNEAWVPTLFLLPCRDCLR